MTEEEDDDDDDDDTDDDDKKDGGVVNLLPLWIVLAVLALLLTSYWCCWRPGWLVWRLARLRNVTCCRVRQKRPLIGWHQHHNDSLPCTRFGLV